MCSSGLYQQYRYASLLSVSSRFRQFLWIAWWVNRPMDLGREGPVGMAELYEFKHFRTSSICSFHFFFHLLYLLEFVISRIIFNWDFHNRCSYQFSKWETSPGKSLHQIGGYHETFRFGSSLVYGPLLLNTLHWDSQVAFLIKMLPNMPLCYWFASQLALAYLILIPSGPELCNW